MTIYKEHTRLSLIEGGNVFKQGDHVTLGFTPRDYAGNVIDLTGKEIAGVIYSNRKGIMYEAPATFDAAEQKISFTIDGPVDYGQFQIEFTVTDASDPDYRLKLPSAEQDGRLTIKPSVDNMDFVGVQMTTVTQLQNELQVMQTEFEGEVLPRVQSVEGRQAEVEGKQVELEETVQAGIGAFTEDTEVVLARMGEANLLAFNEKTAAQLAETEQNVNLRVDELVIGSGNANAEVTDAHVSTVKGRTFTTVRNRFEETETEVLNSQKNLENNRSILIANNAISSIVSSTGVAAMPDSTVEGLPVGFTVKGNSIRSGNTLNNVLITSIATKKENVIKESASLNVALRGLANGVFDTLNEKGEVSRKVGALTLKGTESGWLLDAIGTNISRFALPIANAKGYNGQNIISDLFLYNDITGASADTGNTEFIKFSTTGNLFIGVAKSKLPTADLAGFKSWLSNNNVNISYELKSASYTKEIISLPSLNGYASGELNVVSVLAPELTAYIPLKKEIVDIKQKNNLFNGVFRSDITVSGNSTVNQVYPTTTGTARTAIVPIEKNKPYAIKVKGNHNAFHVALTNSLTAWSNLTKINSYLGSEVSDELSFVNTGGFAYAMITVSSESQEPSVIIHQSSDVPTSSVQLAINQNSVLLKNDTFDLTSYSMRKYSSYFISDDVPAGHHLDFAAVHLDYDGLKDQFGGYITKTILGQDGQGNSLLEYKFSKPNVQNNVGMERLKIGLMSGLHGNERNPVYALYKFMELICHNPYKSEIIEKIIGMVDFYVLPVGNPTGYNLNTRENWNGVNLNRNFTTNWVTPIDSNPGTAPASELETQIIEAWMTDRSFDYFIDYHNSAQVDNIINWFIANSTSDAGKELKKHYYKAVSLLSPKWSERFPEFPKNEVFGHTLNYGTLAQSWSQAETTGAKSCILETAWQVTYSDSTYNGAVSNICAIEILGNLIFNICADHI